MNPKNALPIHYKYLVLCALCFFIAGCAALPPKKPVDDSVRDYPDIEAYKQKSDDTQISLIKILSSEAEKFLWQGYFQDALFVYNQALALADESEKFQLIDAIEKALEQTPAKDIKEFSEIQNVHIPKPLLLYWLGVNYGLEDNSALSKNTLEDFLSRYPDHKYSADAQELVNIISKIFFDRDTIGCLLPLSGKYAVFGQRALTGIQLAIEELSQKYSKEFKLVVKDTKADPDVAEECVRQLHQKNVAAIIGPLLAVRQSGPTSQQLQIPMIALTQKNDFPLQGEYLFANFITPQMQVRTLGAYLFGNLGVKKVAILYPDEKYGKRYMNLFWDIVDEYGAQVVGVEAYDGSKTDFTEAIQKLTGEYFPLPEFLIQENEDPLLDAPLLDEALMDEKGNKLNIEAVLETDEKKEERIQIDFEALFIPDSPSKVKLILPQLAFNDATGMHLLGTNLWHHDSLLKETRGYNKQAIITDGFFGGSRNPATANFKKTYESLFEQAPKFLEAIAYDTANILFTTLMDQSVDSRQALKDALKSNRVFEGATGNTVFDQEGVAHRNLFLMTIKRGKFVEISR